MTFRKTFWGKGESGCWFALQKEGFWFPVWNVWVSEGDWRLIACEPRKSWAIAKAVSYDTYLVKRICRL